MYFIIVLCPCLDISDIIHHHVIYLISTWKEVFIVAFIISEIVHLFHTILLFLINKPNDNMSCLMIKKQPIIKLTHTLPLYAKLNRYCENFDFKKLICDMLCCKYLKWEWHIISHQMMWTWSGRESSHLYFQSTILSHDTLAYPAAIYWPVIIKIK